MNRDHRSDEEQVLAAYTRDGRGYLLRYGPARKRGEAPYEKELWFTAPSVLPVARLLDQLCLRPDCWAVKWS